jgi:uncharacterized protein (TIGR03437 family)
MRLSCLAIALFSALAVDNLQAGVSSLSDAEFYVGLAQLLAMSRDTHTSLSLNGDAVAAFGFLQYSLAFRWLDDGVFVTAAAAPYSQALGARLVAVDGVPIDQVLQSLATMISYENDQWLHDMVAEYLAGQPVPDQVLAAGVAAQIVAANATQVNFIVPDSVAPGPVTVSVLATGQELAAGEATLTATGPGIFVAQPGDPSQPGAVENQDYSLNGSSNPAATGSVVQIYATGYGPGSSQVQVFFADTPAQVMYSGVVGPGLWQINAQVPDGASGQVPVSIIAGNIASNAVTVWVQ